MITGMTLKIGNNNTYTIPVYSYKTINVLNELPFTKRIEYVKLRDLPDKCRSLHNYLEEVNGYKETPLEGDINKDECCLLSCYLDWRDQKNE